MNLPNDRDRIKRYSIADRVSKVSTGQYAKRVAPGRSFQDFVEGLPDLLQSKALLELAEAVVKARRHSKPVFLLYGAHVVKAGLAPLLCQALEEGWVTYAATNGAGTIHDYELACHGHTSEDVAEALEDGSFGMALETGRDWNLAVREGAGRGIGLGQAVGEAILKSAPAERARDSIAATAARVGRPVTSHVAIGTDITHCHPEADGAALGKTSFQDFEVFRRRVAELHDGGVAINVGSAVILPEVFLKALSLARNLSGPVTGFTTANLDMIRHYRPRMNILERPTRASGKALEVTGPHEILIPLLFQMVCERL
jgi:hypothetical protein